MSIEEMSTKPAEHVDEEWNCHIFIGLQADWKQIYPRMRNFSKKVIKVIERTYIPISLFTIAMNSIIR